MDASGNVVARYAQTQKIDEPLAESRSGTISYYEADGLGSITSLSNGSSTLAQTYTFDSFGKLIASSGSITNPFRYTAREFDPETNLYYYRARYYDLTTGRFLSEDPTKFQTGINFYRYVSNNPSLFTDPFGLQKKDDGWFWNTINKWFNWIMAPGKDNRQIPPVNNCVVGDTRLYYEPGPNPFAENGKWEPEWVEFQTEFRHKCEAAAKAGKRNYAMCNAGAGVSGVSAFCSCCEECDEKKK